MNKVLYALLSIIALTSCSSSYNIEGHQRQKNDAAKHHVQKQHRNDGVVGERNLLKHIVHAQQRGRQKGKQNPHRFVRLKQEATLCR